MDLSIYIYRNWAKLGPRKGVIELQAYSDNAKHWIDRRSFIEGPFLKFRLRRKIKKMIGFYEICQSAKQEIASEYMQQPILRHD